MFKKLAVAAAVAGGLVAVSAPAQADGRVSLSIGLGLPIVGYGAPAYYGPPAVYAPPPVYYAPRPYYGPPPVVYAPPERYYAPAIVYRSAPHYYGRHDYQYRGHGNWNRDDGDHGDHGDHGDRGDHGGD